MFNKKTEHKGLWGRLKTYLLTGILVTAPAFITIYIVVAMVRVIDRWAKALVPARFHPDMQIFGVPGVGIAILVLLLIAIGSVATGWFGRLIVTTADRIMTRMPILSSIYSTVKQLFHTFLGDNTNSFKEVVFVEFPRNGCWSIGFVTGDCPEEFPDPDAEMQYVFVPTTPNPTSGFLILVSKSQVRKTTMTVEQGFKYIVSIGIAK